MNERKEFKQYTSNFSDRQSVRTTFRLSKQANEALGWLAKQQKVTMKDVLDTSLEFLGEALGLLALHTSPETLLREIPGINETREIRKTLVLTRGTLKRLKILSEKFGIPRDILIDKAIMSSKEQIIRDGEETKIKHQKALELIANLESEASNVEMSLMMILDEEDPIRNHLGSAVYTIMNLHQAIKDELENGIPIDPNFI